MTLLHSFQEQSVKKASAYPEIKPGMTIRVHQRITEETEKGPKERTQVFEGLVIVKRGRLAFNATITVRKISNGVGVERIFPLSSPTIERIEVVRQAKVRRAKLYYLRDLRGKASKLREFQVSEKELSAAEQLQRDEDEVHAAKVQKQSTIAASETPSTPPAETVTPDTPTTEAPKS